MQDKRVRAARQFPGRPTKRHQTHFPGRPRARGPRWGFIALTIFVAAVLAAFLASWVTSTASQRPTTTPVPTPITTEAPPTQPDASLSTIASGSLADPAAAIEALNALSTSDGYGAPSYDRDLFGDRWADVDRNGCDTRNDILGRDLATPSFKPGTRDCKVLTGTLIDPYSGASVEFVSGQSTSVLVQIDHMVALAWAWRQGAYAWTPEQRELFANNPRNLRAASEAMNQSKSDAGPSRWLPPAPELQCRFVMEWASVVVDYNLTITPADQHAALEVLRSCPA